MSGGIVAIIIIIILIAIVSLAFLFTSRRRKLQQQFGPGYDRALSERDSRIKAESELATRRRRVQNMDIQPLSESARTRYTDQWIAVQEEFVDSPKTAVARGHELLIAVMRERGYPVDDDKQVMADLSVEHAQTVQHFRDARDISARAVTGEAETEELRQAFIHYRALFADLLGEPSESTIQASDTGTAQTGIPETRDASGVRATANGDRAAATTDDYPTGNAAQNPGTKEPAAERQDEVVGIPPQDGRSSRSSQR